MSALRNLVDKLKPTFTKGGKLGFLESTFDAFEIGRAAGRERG